MVSSVLDTGTCTQIDTEPVHFAKFYIYSLAVQMTSLLMKQRRSSWWKYRPNHSQSRVNQSHKDRIGASPQNLSYQSLLVSRKYFLKLTDCTCLASHNEIYDIGSLYMNRTSSKYTCQSWWKRSDRHNGPCSTNSCRCPGNHESSWFLKYLT